MKWELSRVLPASQIAAFTALRRMATPSSGCLVLHFLSILYRLVLVLIVAVHPPLRFLVLGHVRFHIVGNGALERAGIVEPSLRQEEQYQRVSIRKEMPLQHG